MTMDHSLNVIFNFLNLCRRKILDSLFFPIKAIRIAIGPFAPKHRRLRGSSKISFNGILKETFASNIEIKGFSQPLHGANGSRKRIHGGRDKRTLFMSTQK